MKLGVVASTAPLTVRLEGETTNTQVDRVRQGSSGFAVNDLVEVTFLRRLVVVSRLVSP